MGDAVKSASWHRGIITLFREDFRAKFVHEYTWSQGQFHAIQLEDTLIVNTYVTPKKKALLNISPNLRILGSKMIGWVNGYGLVIGTKNSSPAG